MQGIWYHIVPGFVAAIGPTTELANAPLEAIPIYVKGGSILPYQEPALTTVERLVMVEIDMPSLVALQTI